MTTLSLPEHQLRSLGKKLYQLRDLVARIDIPESLPPPPDDQLFWEMFVKRCSAATTVLKQVQSALTPDMYHFAVHPGEQIWRNPAAVHELLLLPEKRPAQASEPLATSTEEAMDWNRNLAEISGLIEHFISDVSLPGFGTSQSSPGTRTRVANEQELIDRLFSTTSEQRLSDSQKTAT
jgi:hypothetical protein